MTARRPAAPLCLLCRHKLTHPLRPSYRAPDAPAAARLRPERNKFEFEYAIPQTALNFDDRAASDPRMRKLKHKSAEVPMKTTHFVGIVRSGALHLHPIQSLQMVRPDMTYLDTAGTGEGTPAAPLAATAVRTAISAQFKRTDDRAVAARNRSYGYFRSQEEADPWIPLVAHGPDAPRAGRVRDLLTSHPDDLFESDEAYEAHVEGVGKALEPAIGSEAAGRYLRAVSGGNQQSINAASLAAQKCVQWGQPPKDSPRAPRQCRCPHRRLALPAVTHHIHHDYRHRNDFRCPCSLPPCRAPSGAACPCRR